MTHGVSRRFTGTGRVYGERAVARFSAAHVCVVGIGGVGSWAAEALCRSAIGRITLIDPDTVAESNTNRQIHALGDNYGKAKTLIMAERLRSINPACQVSAVERRVTPETLDELKSKNIKVIIIILMVAFFKNVISMKMIAVSDALLLALAILALCIGSYFLTKEH